MTLHNWMDDLPQQFLGKKNIELLISVFQKQIDELNQVYKDLRYATNLNTATGQNLKYIGDILSTSTKEAQAILMDASNDEITDESYRKVLQYKALQNNCDCTYEDIMESISILWDTRNLTYVENPDEPATIYISLPDVSLEGMDPSVGRVLAIKPAGVAMIYTIGYATGVNISGIETSDLAKMILKFLGTEKISEEIVFGMKLRAETSIGENVSASVILKRNLWLLDGTYMLDGTRLLNAEREVEVL